MLLKRFLVLSILFTLITSAMFAGCGVQVIEIENTATTMSSETSQNQDEYDIEFTAKFNREENCIDTTLVNNTKILFVYPPSSGEYYLYKQDGDKWKALNSFASAGYSVGPAPISPDEGNNTFQRSYSAYPSTNDNGNNIAEAQKTQYLKPGNYKIALPVEVMISPEYIEYTDDDGTTQNLPLYNKENLEQVRKEAYFTVE